MALLGWMEEAGMDYAICHVNYHKRSSAARDEAIVRQFASDHQRPLFILSCPSDAKTGNFQAWAREQRYAFFELCAKAIGADSLYLGHHQDDALETWMMQKEKYLLPTVYGLQEYAFHNHLQIRRPFLNKSKAELLAWCQDHQIPYGIDESNLTDHYRRNQIRHARIESLSAAQRKELVWKMEEENRRLQLLRSKADHLAREGVFETILSDPEGWLVIDTLFFEQTGHHLSRKEAQDLLEQIRSGRLVERKGVLFQNVEGHLRCEKRHIPVPFYIGSHDMLMKMADEQIAYGWISILCDGARIERFSVDEDDFPLLIRPMEANDVIEMRTFSKKINRLFIDRKVPAIDRMKIPVVTNRDGKVIFAGLAGCDKNHFDKPYPVFLHLKNLLD